MAASYSVRDRPRERRACRGEAARERESGGLRRRM